MENVTVYEYLLDKDKIIKVVHTAKVAGYSYVLKAGKKRRHLKYCEKTN